jgi:putative ABC transport system permease protein
MPSLLTRASRRHLARHPAQLAFAVLGVALGVAVVVAVDLANASALAGFRLSSEAVAGRATHQVTGGPGGLDEALFVALARLPGVEAAPIVEGRVEVAAGPATGRSLRVLGVDPFSEAPFRPWLTRGADEAKTGDLGTFLTLPGAVVLSAETAGELAVAPDDELPVRVAGRDLRLPVVGLLAPEDDLARRALADLLVADVATAQEVLGSLGRLSRIDLRLPGAANGDAAPSPAEAAVRSRLPAGARLLPAGARDRGLVEMTRAFRLNLGALSLLALVCGLFLIVNSMTFSVVQRRSLFGILRCLGATRREVLAAVLGEAAAVAAAGTALGLAGGVLLARGLVGLVSRTIDDLYFALAVRELAVDPASLARGAALGLAATVAAALLPAREAASVPPRAALVRSTLEGARRRALPRQAATAVALLAAGAALVAWPTRALLPAFAGLFALIVGLALLAPGATVLLMRLAAPLARRLAGSLGAMAARGVADSLSRTGVAIAALAVAVSVTVGVGVMVDSFRGTVARWLEGALAADLYVRAAGPSGALGAAPLPEGLAERFAALPGVARAGSIRWMQLLDAEGRPLRLAAVEPDAEDFARLDFAGAAGGLFGRGGGAGAGAAERRRRRGGSTVPADRRDAWRAFAAGHAVLVSEPFAFRRGLAAGDAVVLPTDRGPRRFPIAAVTVSYASDQGFVTIARPGFERWWDDRGLSGISLHLAPGASADAVEAALRRAAGGLVLDVEHRGELRRASLAVFDRTFRITVVLRLLAALVAAVGVVAALAALQLERARELGVLRALGLTPGRLGGLITAQSALMGLAAGLLSLPVGLLLAVVMVQVVNRRSFGWTMELAVAPGVLVEAVALAVGAAVVAGAWPAWRMGRTQAVEALREE